MTTKKNAAAYVPPRPANLKVWIPPHMHRALRVLSIERGWVMGDLVADALHDYYGIPLQPPPAEEPLIEPAP